MWNPAVETLTFLVFAIVLNAVVFGGVTLAYFLDQRRVDRIQETLTGAEALATSARPVRSHR